MVAFFGLFKCVLYAAACLSVLAAPGAVWADCVSGDCAAATVGKPTIRIGYSQFPPFSRTSPTGIAEGYSIDLIRQLLEPQGYSLIFIPNDNPAVMLENLAAGRIDMTSLLVDTAARREVGAFTKHVGSIDIRIFVAEGTPVPKSADDLKGLRIGAADGSIGYRLAEGVEGASVVPFLNSNGLLLPLLTGQIDAVSSPHESLIYLANQAQLAHRLVRTDVALRQSPFGLLIDPDNATLLDDLNTAIDAAQASGQLTRLYDSWFAARAAPLTSRERLLTGGAILAVLLLLGYWARLHYVVLRRARRMEARSELLSETLDATGSSLVVFDESMRPILWNDAFFRNYPKQVPLLKAGHTMEELMVAAFQNGSFGSVMSTEEARAEAAKRVETLRGGGEVNVLHTVGTSVLRRRSLKLPNGKYAAIASDVTELVRAQTRLEDMTRQLEGANQRLIEFNRLAAHDLVAPLRNLRNLHGWIRDDIQELGISLDEETLENFQSVDTLLERQSRMIEDLLEYSASAPRQAATEFDPNERFSDILQLCNIPKGFRVILPSGVPHLKADPIAFDIVVRNLISNAVKHHDRDRGVVELSVEANGSSATFEVRDDGPGVREDALGKIFEPFARLKSRDAGGGTGLGLAFIKRSVTDWGGNVVAISKDGERGTVFRFDVPLARRVTRELPVEAAKAC